MANWLSLSFSEVGNKHIPGSHLVSNANQSGKCILNTAQTQWENSFFWRNFRQLALSRSLNN